MFACGYLQDSVAISFDHKEATASGAVVLTPLSWLWLK